MYKRQLCYFVVVCLYAVNAPIWDEYYSVLEYFNHFLSSNSFLEKATIFFTNQHNGHRLYLNNLLLTAFYYVFGQINFKALTLIGNLFLVGIFYVFYKAYKLESYKWNVLVVATLLVNFQYYTVSVMEIASIEFFGAFFLVFLSLYLLTKEKKVAFFIAIFLGLLGAYTCAHGVLLAPVAFLFLILKKNYKKAIVWFVINAPLIYVYTLDLKKGWGSEKIDVFANLFQHTSEVTLFFLKMLGANILVFGDLRSVTPYIGALILLITVIQLFKLFQKKELLLIVSLLLILGSLLLISVGRLQLALPYEFRFRLYSSILIVLLYISFLRLYNSQLNSIIQKIIVLCSVFYFVSTFFTYRDYLSNWHNRYQVNKDCYLTNTIQSYSYRCPSQKKAVRFLKEAKELGYYTHHTTSCVVKQSEIGDELTIDLKNLITSNAFILSATINLIDSNLIVKGWGFLKGFHNLENEYFLMFTNNENQILFETLDVIRPNIRFRVNAPNDYIGFEKVIPKTCLKKGSYQINVLLYAKDEKVCYSKLMYQNYQID